MAAMWTELSNEQRRQFVDAQQLSSTLQAAATELASLGGLYWNTSKGVRYLYRKIDGARTSLGRETSELVAMKKAHDASRRRLQGTLRSLANRREQMAPVNRALRIGRLPVTAAQIIRRLNTEGMLGDHIIIAGTNALYAYEAAAGVLIGGEFVATSDADLLWDARRYLELAASPIARTGLMGLLREVDDSFVAHYGFNATNNEGYIIDLISPEPAAGRTRLGDGPDLEATPMIGAQWLLDAPRFEQVVVGADGVPLRIVVPEPRTFALHKLWLSKRDDRQPLKKPRDAAQSRLVADLSRQFLGLEFTASKMPWLPGELKAFLKTV